MKSYTLKELTDYIHRVVALNFQEPLWVKAEILQVKENRGHTYIELIEKDQSQDHISAQAQAILWSKTRTKINQEFPGNLGEYLKPGTEVSLLVMVTYHPIFGLKLSIQNLDPSYTLGKLELLKQSTLKRISREGLIDRNQRQYLPPVLQRIAVISSQKASGYQDFIRHLKKNNQGYAIDCKLFATAMQGSKMVGEMQKSLRSINAQKPSFDCIVIIRGGGSKLDLSFFDQYEIARPIALAELPILTGIGHETDSTVADSVSYRSLKTPTAVASFILDRNYAFESEIEFLRDSIIRSGYNSLIIQDRTIENCWRDVVHAGKQLVQHSHHIIARTESGLHHTLHKNLQENRSELKGIKQKLQLLHPHAMMCRGYSLTTLDGKILKDARILHKGDLVETHLLNSRFTSEVKKIHKHE